MGTKYQSVPDPSQKAGLNYRVPNTQQDYKWKKQKREKSITKGPSESNKKYKATPSFIPFQVGIRFVLGVILHKHPKGHVNFNSELSESQILLPKQKT